MRIKQFESQTIMKSNDPVEHARYIFTTGKMIHDRIFLIRAAHLAGNKNRRFDDLSVAQLHMLMVVRMCGRVSIKKLSALLGVKPPAASVMVDRLVEKNLLNRETRTEDRRKVAITVSPEVRADFEQLEEVVFKSFVDLVKNIGPETAAKWCDVLERVKTAIGEDVK